MSGFKSVLLAGTGYVGSKAAEVFLSTPGWAVHILATADSLARKKAVYDKFAAQGAKIITADISKPETYAAQLAGIDVVMSFLAPSVGDLSIALAKASKQAGVKLYLPSEYSFELSNIADFPFTVVKQQVRDAVESLGLNYMYIITGPFYEYYIGCPDWGADVKNNKIALIGDRAAKTTAASMDESIELLPQIINDPSNLNKSVFLGYTMTTGEVFDSIVAALGKSAQTESITLESLQVKIANAASFAEKIPLWILTIIGTGRTEVPNPIDGAKYGKPFTPFAEFARKYVAGLKNNTISTVYSDKNEAGFQKTLSQIQQ